MGMFTTIITTDLRHIQIKCGWDECETYQVGQAVKQYVIPDWPGEGYLLDDVYDSYGDKGESDFVIIKDGFVLATEDREAAFEAAEAKGQSVWQFLKEKHGVKEPERSLWTEEAWQKLEERHREFDEENALFQASIAHLDENERFIRQMVRGIFGKRLDYVSIARKIFVVEPMSEGARPYFFPKKEEGS